jgi:hypothetical protein
MNQQRGDVWMLAHFSHQWRDFHEVWPGPDNIEYFH